MNLKPIQDFHPKYLGFPCSGKRSKGDIGGKSCRDTLGLLLSVVVDPVVVKGKRVVTFKWNGWRVWDSDLRRRRLTPVEKNLPVDHILGDVPLGGCGLHLLDCKEDVFRPANPGFSQSVAFQYLTTLFTLKPPHTADHVRMRGRPPAIPPPSSESAPAL